jgi:NAD(P)-dependent dehydrogenase (short-subunit alcohol dehydrogenase family)
MIRIDFEGAAAVVTGGTRGLGLAAGIELGRAGASVFLTHRWGSVGEDEVAASFEKEGLAPPTVIESDASDPDASRELMAAVKARGRPLHVVVSNVAFSKIVRDLGELRRGALDLSIGYSAWPVVDLVQAAHEVLGGFPRYVIGISSDGSEVCHAGYDLAGASKALLETFCRYLALRLKPHGVRVNALRPGFLDTASSRATFGEEVLAAAGERLPGLFLDTRRVARACVALASGLLDAVTGQVIPVDEGWSLVSPIAFLTGRGAPGAFPAEGGA